MVCKKCGMELIEGIDICPYCGEDNKKVEENNVNNILNDLNSLKMDVPSDVEQKEEIKQINDVKEKDLFKSIDKEDKIEIEEEKKDEDDYYSSLTEVNSEDNKVESIPVPNIDDYLNSSIIRNENTKKEDTINIDDVLNQIKSISDKIENDFNVEDKNENIEIDINKTPEENIEIDNQSDKKDEIDSNIISEDIKENNIDESFDDKDKNKINIENLISDLKEIPVEETTETKELVAPIIGEPLVNDIKNIEVDDITPLDTPQIDIVEDKKDEIVENSIKNDYLITPDISKEQQQEVYEEQTENIDLPEIPVEETNNEEVPNIETPQENIEINDEKSKENLIEENHNSEIEENKSEIEESKEDDTLRLQESKLPIDKEEQQEVYINPILETAEPPKMPDIPVVLPKKEEAFMPELTTNPQATQILMPEDIKPNIQEEVSNTPQEKMPQEPKKSGNSMTVLLFILMIILGVAVALVVSYIFNM